MKDKKENRNEGNNEDQEIHNENQNTPSNHSKNTPRNGDLLSEGMFIGNYFNNPREYINGIIDTKENTMFQGHSLPAMEERRRGIRDSKKLEKALALSPSMILILDRWGNIEYANPRFLQVTGYTESELKGKDTEVFASRMKLTSSLLDLRNAIQKGRKWKGEVYQLKKDSTIYVFSGKLDPLENEYDFITGFILTGEDITTFRQTELALKRALEEKNVVLAELHHRVKNNLAIVSGLMQLQAFNEPDEYMQGRLFASAGRVKSLASMHEVLYESKSLAKVKIAPILERIIQSVEDHFLSSNLNINIKAEIGEVELNINQAHPCCLILNEVITNAYKHAFDHNQPGSLFIKIYEQDQTVFITVTDNGKGLSADYHKLGMQKKTTGYELLNSLTGQLGGEFKYKSGELGTKFFFRFKKEDANGASNANLIPGV